MALILLCWVAAAGALPRGIVAERYVEGLANPTAMTIAPSGDILVTEKGGEVRLVRDGNLVAGPVVRFSPTVKGQAGLLGIDVFDDFAESGRFIVAYTPASDPTRIWLSRARMTPEGGEVLEDPWKVLPNNPDSDRNYAGRVEVADGHIYVGLGDLGRHNEAQSTRRLPGSILRYNLDGTVPADNPFGTAVYAYGFRNPQGFETVGDGTLWVVDSGETEHDEISRVVAGGNYGWPVVIGHCDNYPLTEVCDETSLLDPHYEFRWQTRVTGVAGYREGLMPALRGSVFVTGRRYGELHRLVSTADGRRLELAVPFFVLPGSEPQAGLVDVKVGTDGALYVLVGDTPAGQILRIAPREDVLDQNAILEEGTELRPADTPVCTVSQVDAAVPWSQGALLVICLVLLVWALRRREVPRAVTICACLLAVLTLWSAKVHAQEARWGVKAGANVATVSGDDVVTASLAPGVTAGVASRFEFNEYLAVAPELIYAWKGTGIDSVDDRHLSHHLTLPVFMEGRLNFGWIEPRLTAGPAATLVLSARTGDQIMTDRLNRWGFAVAGGLGADFGFGSGMMTVDARFERGLTEVYDDRATPHYIRTPENYNNVAYLLVGYLF
ncbi:PQQ-dependent sugar dehydrogenase [Persicimonas caeni]|uniref:PQQ-dependent sugar dehydrogenase n=1 Tax=Persicimonas caeni TaxID=2292766 RepID=UPI00143DA073|nr:PQQ-dependent sugar dehydrogenase [Persicimonas caeni]